MNHPVCEFLERNSAAYYEISDKIWDFAELAYEEEKTSKLQADYMESRGFRVTRNVGGVPNAILAEWGAGKPVIGIFGELDALPATSQKADVAEKAAIVEGASGHGCGHNLLGTAAMAAVDALKAHMEANGNTGTVRYYGCPAEEYGSGKAHMARNGLFDDVDIALGWHPFPYTEIGNTGWIANLMVRYVFHGITANPAHSGHLGRSALDAAELMGVGTQYLREHVPSDIRIHYAYQDAGGVAPNVIPSKVEVNYFVRGNRIEDAMAVKLRVDKIAQGAAMMTETTVESFLHNGMVDFQKNTVIDSVLLEKLKEVSMPQFTEEELAYAEKFRAVTAESNIQGYREKLQQYCGLSGEALEAEMAKPISQLIIPEGIPMNGSTDFGDVSQLVPAGQFLATCFTIGCPCHSWQACAEGKSAVAHKGELYAAKVLATSALDFLENPEKVAAAKEEFLERRNGTVYECPIPAEIGPHGYEY